MGGYPALAIRPPESPLQQLGQAQQVVGARQEEQLRALQIQAATRAQNDLDATTRAFSQLTPDANGQVNYDALPDLVRRAGGSANAIMGATNNVFAMKAKAAEIAKDQAQTGLAQVNTAAKQNDQYRGRILNIAGIQDPVAKQAAWEQEITSEEQSGKIQPGALPHQYPGDDAATAMANHLALGSQLVKEQQEQTKLGLDAWKSVGGRLVNAVTHEEIGGLSNVPQLNKALENVWQVGHPGEALPAAFTLGPNATPDDFKRANEMMDVAAKEHLTVKQEEVVNTMKQQMFEMQRDKTDMQAVVGQDKSGKAVMVPMGQAQQLGLQNVMKAPEDTVNKALAARHWLQLAQTQADPKAKPEDMGIQQLVDKLDSEGKLGPIASRWNEFMTGKVGAGDPEVSALRAKMGLSTTLLMQAHVGSRGSSQMLEHFEDLANQKKLDGPTLKAALGAEVNYIQDRAMDPNPPTFKQAPTAAPQPAAPEHKPGGKAAGLKEGQTGTGSDGKKYVVKGGVWVAQSQ